MGEITIYTICAIVSVVLTAIAGFLIARLKNLLKKQKALENGVQSLLRCQIIHTYNRSKDKGYCPIYELENVESAFKEYAALGGNGTIEQLVKELRAMPRK